MLKYRCSNLKTSFCRILCNENCISCLSKKKKFSNNVIISSSFFFSIYTSTNCKYINTAFCCIAHQIDDVVEIVCGTVFTFILITCKNVYGLILFNFRNKNLSTRTILWRPYSFKQTVF